MMIGFAAREVALGAASEVASGMALEVARTC
jgi:hypothetical protein